MRSVSLFSLRRRLAPALLALALCLSLFITGCASSASGSHDTAGTPTAQKPLLATDAYGAPITIPATAPQRIISLTPGDSEMLAAVGASARVIGVDALTNYPADMAAKPKVTDGTDNPNVEQIIALKPDLVLTWNKFTEQAVKALQQANINVVALPDEDLEGTLTEIRLVGQLTHTSSTADAVVKSLEQRIAAIKQKVASATPARVYMEISFTPPPPYVVGGGSFANDVLRDAGGSNIFAARTENGGYPAVSVESIIAANPQVIILAEDPQYGGDPKQVSQRPGWSAIAAVQAHRVYDINPDIVSRPGPRLVDAIEQVAKMLHPDLFA
ncbi:MAG: ABC transporter substrate-binding protein [Nitrososphaerota archaeon]